MVLEGTFGASAIHTAPLLLRAQYRLTLLCTLAHTLLPKKIVIQCYKAHSLTAN